jgi:antirestriction protein ArdC
MPPFEAFASPESYYATLAHESTHWTKHPARLAREFGRKQWGDEGYAEEELVAELGAAFLCADLELSLSPREDHASYITHWLTVLKNDKGPSSVPRPTRGAPPTSCTACNRPPSGRLPYHPH